jgi:Lamin Tail Domain/RTX calcium-binding nonapeptide repeat (4 copies)
VSEIFISEYIEGSSNNKAIELYNPTAEIIDLATSSYSLELYSNGSATPNNSLNLVGSIEPGETFILTHGSANQTLLNQADVTNNFVINFNGDDAIVLKKNGTVIDAIGQIGFDPGTQWGSGNISTLNHTLRRRSNVTMGDPNPNDIFDPSVEWEGFANDTFDGINSHSITDVISPTITLEQANEQTDPTSSTTVRFTATFSEPVTGFDANDIDLSQSTTSGMLTATVTETGTMDGTIYEIAVTGMTGNGEVVATVAANAATDASGNPNTPSTSIDNTVTFNNTVPTIDNITRTNPNPTSASSVSYTVQFSEAVTGVDATDFELVTSGISAAKITQVIGTDDTYTVEVDTGTGDGTIQLNLVDDDSITNELMVPLGGMGVNNGDATGERYDFDRTLPAATAEFVDIIVAGGTVYPFAVTYTDNTGIDIDTVGSGDVRVFGGNGFDELIKFVSAETTGNTTTATYQFIPPGGTWDRSDNGIYTVSLLANEVQDTTGQGVSAGDLGNFIVNIPLPPSGNNPTPNPSTPNNPTPNNPTPNNPTPNNPTPNNPTPNNPPNPPNPPAIFPNFDTCQLTTIPPVFPTAEPTTNTQTGEFLLGDDNPNTLEGQTQNSVTFAGFAGNDYLQGSPGEDWLFANQGEDIVEAGMGDDWVFGGREGDAMRGNAGNDRLLGNFDNDLLFGDEGDDFIFGNSGIDSIDGGTGNDLIFAGKDDDRVFGGDGGDVILGNIGNDCLHGQAGNDLLYGHTGGDTVTGGEWSDTLFGGQDGDILLGEVGTDVLSGDRGDDTLTGGIGGDRFDFRRDDGSDTITDFTDGVDIIGLKEGLTFAELSIVQVGNDTQISADGLTIRLVGIEIGAIDVADFAAV